MNVGEWNVDILHPELLVDIAEHIFKGIREGWPLTTTFLGATDFGGGDKPHGFNDLLRVIL